jgi:hypothetical protein
MANYTNWNTAIARYFTSNVPSGSGIFLTLNDDTLHEIASNFLKAELGTRDPSLDFVEAVRAQVVMDGGLSIDSVCGDNSGDYPLGVGFLGLMVLAAHRMDNSDGIDELNYFKRLTELLRVPQKYGPRPAGLRAGNEESLWRNWNEWLQKRSWQPTAQPGPDGPRKYLNYVFTQALVRDGDKSYLQTRFRENLGARGITIDMDEVQLAGWLQSTDAITRRYLREGFRSSNPRRAAAFYEATYRVFQSTSWDNATAASAVRRSRIINAGLIRSVSLSGQISYRMFVPQPTNWIPKPLAIVLSDGKSTPLTSGRIGHFKPLAIQSPFVASSLSFGLMGDELLEAIVFPRRDFWILTPDPEDQTGALATWEKFPNLLGQKFTLICPSEGNEVVQAELKTFREAKLLDWDSGPIQVSGTKVEEYRGCMVLSSAWDSVIPGNQWIGLYEALKPKQFATLSLAGGIRAPEQNAWLVGHPPEVKIYGFENVFKLRLRAGSDEKFAKEQQRQVPLQLDQKLAPGIYSLEASLNDQLLATRSFRLIEWEEIEAKQPPSESGPSITLSGRSLRASGAIIEEIPTDH